MECEKIHCMSVASWRVNCSAVIMSQEGPNSTPDPKPSGLQHNHPEINASKVQPFDFRRTDRISKSQIRAIEMLHENFARSVASSLSAYLRTYLSVTLIGTEQMSYAEFIDTLPAAT